MLRAFLTLVFNLINLVRSATRQLFKLLPGNKPRPRRYVKVTLPPGVQLTGQVRKLGPIAVGLPSRGSWWVFDDLIKRLSRDRDVEGVIFKLDKGPASLTAAAAVADKMAVLRRSGKRVVAHIDQGMVKDYVTATAADTITMTPPGRLYTFGTRLEMTFLGQVFEKVGVKAQFIHLGKYKTAMHRFTRKAITRPQQIMMRQLAMGLNQHIAERIAKRRGITTDQAQQLFARAPLSARDARRFGLIDHMIYGDQIKETLEAELDCDRKVQILTTAQYLSASPQLRWKPVKARQARIAVIDLKGTIMMGNEGALPGQMRNALTPGPVVKALKAVEKDKTIKGLVLRIDSPGGSALASDLMWRQIRRVAKKKPVVASIGNVAASGGYYLAVACDEILAHPESITGSIGVIAGKVTGGELIDKLGVRIDAVTDQHGSAFASLTTALSDEEMVNLRKDIRSFYRRFIQRVAAGRKISRRRVNRLGRGRVYTGSRAKAVGLVDHLGGLDDAVEVACKRAGLDRGKADVVFLDHSKPSIKGAFGLGAAAHIADDTQAELLASTPTDDASPIAQLAAQALPEALEPYVAAALLMRRPEALALMPYLPYER